MSTRRNGDDDDRRDEVVSLNSELMDVDFSDVTAEELERRLELAIGLMPMLSAVCGGVNACDSFSGNADCQSGNNCHGFSG